MRSSGQTSRSSLILTRSQLVAQFLPLKWHLALTGREVGIPRRASAPQPQPPQKCWARPSPTGRRVRRKTRDCRRRPRTPLPDGPSRRRSNGGGVARHAGPPALSGRQTRRLDRRHGRRSRPFIGVRHHGPDHAFSSRPPDIPDIRSPSPAAGGRTPIRAYRLGRFWWKRHRLGCDDGAGLTSADSLIEG